MRDIRRAAALDIIINEARGGHLRLWGQADTHPASLPVELPPGFLLGTITFDTSLRHLGLAQAVETPTLQRAIIARNGKRASAFFNVTMMRDDLNVLLVRWQRAHAQRHPSKDEAVTRNWYLEKYISQHVKAGTIPSRDEDLEALRARFPGTPKLRDLARSLRREHAPPHWRAHGRRRQTGAQ